ncbi:NEDD4 family-interacting protein 1 [Turdus rufiventris]|nr:NEDD4 family-interacting protein 1 [Turdus rufiventris]
MAAAAAEPSTGRYQQLQNEEEPGEAVPVVNDAPPPYSSISAESTAYFDYKDESGFPKPPSYNVATTLPSYDEAERSKAEATIPLVPGRDEDFVTRDDFDDTDQLRIGNDGIFMLTFFMAFLFNWIGFFLSFCLTTSAAGRYGAISGFGLSLIKWILIVRFSTYFPGYFDGQYWLWWVFLVLVSMEEGKATQEEKAQLEGEQLVLEEIRSACGGEPDPSPQSSQLEMERKELFTDLNFLKLLE